MNLHEIGRHLLPNVELSLVKVGPRKSAAQPHLWMLCDEERPRAVAKFAPRGESSAPARRKVEREAEFLRAVGDLPSDHFLRRDTPELLRVVDEEGEGRAVVTRFDPRPSSRAWVVERFGRDPLSLATWLGERLDWLERLQSEAALRERLEIPEGSVLQHGDFSHYNMLGGPDQRPSVLDWEDWSVSSEPFHDALHLAVLPTLAERGEDELRRSFRRHWIEGSPWSRLFHERAEAFFPDPGDRDQALESYLRQQLRATETDAVGIRRIFEVALEELARARGG